MSQARPAERITRALKTKNSHFFKAASTIHAQDLSTDGVDELEAIRWDSQWAALPLVVGPVERQ
jgi:hypothetical protein